MSDNTQPNYLNKKQSQWVYDTVVGTKEPVSYTHLTLPTNDRV